LIEDQPALSTKAASTLDTMPPKTKKTADDKDGSSKPSKKPALKSVLDKVVYAIRQHPEAKSAKGVSRVTLKKYLKVELDYDNANAIKTALKKGTDTGVLEQVGQCFRVKGDPIVESAEEKVEITEVKEGSGDEIAEDGDTVTMKYVGKLDDGHQFDAASSFAFVLGAGDVIKGWDQGIKGMKVGQKRKLVVPPKLGYGKRGCAPDIPGNATLHFTVELKKLDKAK